MFLRIFFDAVVDRPGSLLQCGSDFLQRGAVLREQRRLQQDEIDRVIRLVAEGIGAKLLLQREHLLVLALQNRVDPRHAFQYQRKEADDEWRQIAAVSKSSRCSNATPSSS